MKNINFNNFKNMLIYHIKKYPEFLVLLVAIFYLLYNFMGTIFLKLEDSLLYTMLGSIYIIFNLCLKNVDYVRYKNYIINNQITIKKELYLILIRTLIFILIISTVSTLKLLIFNHAIPITVILNFTIIILLTEIIALLYIKNDVYTANITRKIIVKLSLLSIILTEISKYFILMLVFVIIMIIYSKAKYKINNFQIFNISVFGILSYSILLIIMFSYKQANILYIYLAFSMFVLNEFYSKLRNKTFFINDYKIVTKQIIIFYIIYIASIMFLETINIKLVIIATFLYFSVIYVYAKVEVEKIIQSFLEIGIIFSIMYLTTLDLKIEYISIFLIIPLIVEIFILNYKNIINVILKLIVISIPLMIIFNIRYVFIFIMTLLINEIIHLYLYKYFVGFYNINNSKWYCISFMYNKIDHMNKKELIVFYLAPSLIIMALGIIISFHNYEYGLICLLQIINLIPLKIGTVMDKLLSKLSLIKKSKSI